MILPDKATNIRLLVALFLVLATAATVLLVRRSTQRRASEVLATKLSLAAKAGRQIVFKPAPTNAV